MESKPKRDIEIKPARAMIVQTLFIVPIITNQEYINNKQLKIPLWMRDRIGQQVPLT